MFTPQKMTPEFALRAARNFDVTDMPEISMEKIDEIIRLYSDSNFEGIIKSLNLPDVHPISVYITKLRSQTDDAEAYNSFVTGIIEKLLTSESLRRAHKGAGLQDKYYEIVLGRALVLQAMEKEKTRGKGVSVKHDYLGRTMKEAEEKLFETLQSLIPKAFDSKDPQAINAIAELIPAIAEERRKRLTRDDLKPDMSMKNYESILSAA
jgi:ATP-dependent RNA circularization protein (DNA/RNA ligase family)